VYQINIKSAPDIATKLLNKKVTQSNILYLMQYGIIDYIPNNSITFPTLSNS